MHPAGKDAASRHRPTSPACISVHLDRAGRPPRTPALGRQHGRCPQPRCAVRRPDMAASGSNPTTAPAAAPALPGVELFNAWRTEMQRAMLQTSRTFDVLRDQKPANVGKTPKDVIWKQGTAQLYRYRRTAENVHPIPLLMVHSLVSKPYILDL